ncbi:hypothetical protein C8R44DRAFT_728431 [Mycena epipterygia]|nr:hypothetical protein C8R44DRAFT_728431 [Mycena epipterygia]
MQGASCSRFLTLPELQRSAFYATDDRVLPSLEHLLQRSMAAPKSLLIQDFVSTPELIAVLAAAPSITELIIDQSAVRSIVASEHFFELFIDGGDTPPLIPALRTLSITGLAFGESFVRMVEARCLPREANGWAGVGRLESLAIANVRDTHISCG